MIMDLCEAYRFQTRLPPMVLKRLAAGSQLEHGPTGHRLTWPGGEATFHDRGQAVTFSWVINAEPDTIMASYQHVNGEPLFDLDIPVDEWSIHTARRRPGGRIPQPRVETPPPDGEGAADRAAIDALLADRRWERRAPGGDLLWVGDRHQGRAIAYRQSQFVYESTTGMGRYRDTKATFSTAAAACRFPAPRAERRGPPVDRHAQDPAEPARSPLHPRGRTHRLRAHLARRPSHLPGRCQGAHGRAELQLGHQGRTRGDRRQLPPPKRGTALRSAP